MSYSAQIFSNKSEVTMVFTILCDFSKVPLDFLNFKIESINKAAVWFPFNKI